LSFLRTLEKKVDKYSKTLSKKKGFKGDYSGVVAGPVESLGEMFVFGTPDQF
jgi:hypothetical protein